jgi:hypothetical protein
MQNRGSSKQFPFSPVQSRGFLWLPLASNAGNGDFDGVNQVVKWGKKGYSSRTAARLPIFSVPYFRRRLTYAASKRS